MFGNSRVPDIARGARPETLKTLIERHLHHQWQPPVPEHDCQAFEQARIWRSEKGPHKSLILDSGCGTGASSVILASRHPGTLVIGLDKSAARLERAARRFDLPENLLLLRTDCAVFWLLACRAGWSLNGHYLLYPNPWPKPGHLKRRWYGHPAFPQLLALGGTLEVRTNWQPYVDDLSRALALVGKDAGIVEPVSGDSMAMTDFEQKYRASQQALYRLTATLS